MAYKDMSFMFGKTYGRLLVLGISYPVKEKSLAWCACSCGTMLHKRTNSILQGITKSCGCLKPESTARRHTTHGNTKNRKHTGSYSSWSAMIARCLNPKNVKYAYYGGRGITVCDRWKTFENFLRDMGPRPEGLTLDRIDNEQGYSPENCRWTTRKQQAENRRGNRQVVFEGHPTTVSVLAERFAISEARLRGRLSRGWNVEDAITRKPYERVAVRASTRNR